jgi:hypothetical protein
VKPTKSSNTFPPQHLWYKQWVQTHQSWRNTRTFSVICHVSSTQIWLWCNSSR